MNMFYHINSVSPIQDTVASGTIPKVTAVFAHTETSGQGDVVEKICSNMF